jgi:hypothetical protein
MSNIKKRKKAMSWMVMEDIRNVDIQRALGFKHHVRVSETLRGVRNDRKVLGYLLELGCPAKDLNLPEDMKE